MPPKNTRQTMKMKPVFQAPLQNSQKHYKTIKPLSNQLLLYLITLENNLPKDLLFNK